MQVQIIVICFILMTAIMFTVTACGSGGHSTTDRVYSMVESESDSETYANTTTSYTAESNTNINSQENYTTADVQLPSNDTSEDVNKESSHTFTPRPPSTPTIPTPPPPSKPQVK